MSLEGYPRSWGKVPAEGRESIYALLLQERDLNRIKAATLGRQGLHIQAKACSDYALSCELAAIKLGWTKPRLNSDGLKPSVK